MNRAQSHNRQKNQHPSAHLHLGNSMDLFQAVGVAWKLRSKTFLIGVGTSILASRSQTQRDPYHTRQVLADPSVFFPMGFSPDPRNKPNTKQIVTRWARGFLSIRNLSFPIVELGIFQNGFSHRGWNENGSSLTKTPARSIQKVSLPAQRTPHVPFVKAGIGSGGELGYGGVTFGSFGRRF